MQTHVYTFSETKLKVRTLCNETVAHKCFNKSEIQYYFISYRNGSTIGVTQMREVGEQMHISLSCKNMKTIRCDCTLYLQSVQL